MNGRDWSAALEDDEAWTTLDGDRTRLVDLSPQRRDELLTWLHRNARALMEAWFAPRHIGGNFALGMAHARSLDQVPDPHEWLYEQPLVVRLSELTRDDELAAEQEAAL